MLLCETIGQVGAPCAYPVPWLCLSACVLVLYYCELRLLGAALGSRRFRWLVCHLLSPMCKLLVILIELLGPFSSIELMPTISHELFIVTISSCFVGHSEKSARGRRYVIYNYVSLSVAKCHQSYYLPNCRKDGAALIAPLSEPRTPPALSGIDTKPCNGSRERFLPSGRFDRVSIPTVNHPQKERPSHQTGSHH